MSTGITLSRYQRIYIEGQDMSGYTREIGPLTWTYPEIDQVSKLDAVIGTLLDTPDINVGTLNGIFDNTVTSGIHTALSTAGVLRDVLIAQGIQAAPVAGDPVFMFPQSHAGYLPAPSGGDLALTVKFAKTSPAEFMLYDQPWGVLLHANEAATAANTAVGIDDNGASSAKGGWLMYHNLSVVGEGDVTISIDEASTNTNPNFAALSGATSGAIAHTAVPCSGIVQLGNTAAVKRYLRWQIALSGITSCNFVLAFVRGR